MLSTPRFAVSPKLRSRVSPRLLAELERRARAGRDRAAHRSRATSRGSDFGSSMTPRWRSCTRRTWAESGPTDVLSFTPAGLGDDESIGDIAIDWDAVRAAGREHLDACAPRRGHGVVGARARALARPRSSRAQRRPAHASTRAARARELARGRSAAHLRSSPARSRVSGDSRPMVLVHGGGGHGLGGTSRIRDRRSPTRGRARARVSARARRPRRRLRRRGDRRGAIAGRRSHVQRWTRRVHDLGRGVRTRRWDHARPRSCLRSDPRPCATSRTPACSRAR